tara:strand:+ start:185 stop:505 length:321 start_codon:yes stop_codon:yes gene_type:complete
MILIKTVIFLITLTFFSFNATAETKLDCSMYSTKTFTGLLDKMKCKKGIKPEERKKSGTFSELNPFQPRDADGNIIPKKVKSCEELTTKNFKDMVAKFKCEKKWGY